MPSPKHPFKLVPISQEQMDDTALAKRIMVDVGPTTNGADPTFSLAITPDQIVEVAGPQVPAGHASSHSSTGDDPITIDHSQVSGLGTAALRNVPASGDASSIEVVKGNDSRLTNSRAPTAHASSHAAAGSDPITISESQVTNLVSDLAAKADSSAALTALSTVGAPSAANKLLLSTAASTWSLKSLSELVSYGSLGQRPTASATIAGAIYVNTTSRLIQVCNGATWVSVAATGPIRTEVVDTAARLALTNIALTDIVAEIGRVEIQTVIVPSNAGNLLAGRYFIIYDGNNASHAFWFHVLAAAERTYITTVGDTNRSLSSKWFGIYDNSSQVRVWMHLDWATEQGNINCLGLGGADFYVGGSPGVSEQGYIGFSGRSGSWFHTSIDPVQEAGYIEFTGLNGGNYSTGGEGHWFKLFLPSGTTYLVWFNTGSESIPSEGANYVMMVNINTYDIASDIASAIVNQAGSGLAGAFTVGTDNTRFTYVTVIDSGGDCNDPMTSGPHTTQVTTQGVTGVTNNGRYFDLYYPGNTTRWWFNTGSENAPAGATNQISCSPSYTDVDMAAAAAAALNANPNFSASVDGGVDTQVNYVVDAVGSVTNIDVGTSGLQVGVTVEGEDTTNYGKYFFLFAANTNYAHAFWFNTGTESAPINIGAVSTTEIVIAPSATTEDIAWAIYVAVDGHSDFVAVDNGTSVDYSCATPGPASDGSAATTALDITVSVQGSLESSNPGGPRTIRVDISENDSANAVAAAVAAALDADAQFSATATGNLVDCVVNSTDNLNNAFDGNTGFTITVRTQGGPTGEPAHGADFAWQVDMVDGDDSLTVATALYDAALVAVGAFNADNSEVSANRKVRFVNNQKANVTNPSQDSYNMFTLAVEQNGVNPGGTYIVVNPAQPGSESAFKLL